MLFHSPVFLFAFLPTVFVGFFFLGVGRRFALAALWLALASLIFYAWDDPFYLLPLILGSIAFNFLIGRALIGDRRRWLLVVGVGGNLALLATFKYLGLITETLASAGVPLSAAKFALPIGISFYTFTQIAFLVDAYRGEVREYSPVHYLLFVTFFPHLIAGPILHHKEVMPQFANRRTYVLSWPSVLLGLSWFAAGLFKKVVLADGVAAFADPVFSAAEAGHQLSTGAAWIGTLSYSLQIYFDFSGYSDMAIGLALLFGITFPLNFYSPYKATSLIDFWRRWHMTLSRFLRDYLYFPLGGNRKGPTRRALNLMVTMLLGGLWHGASWNFAIWGGIHGLGLLVDHHWRRQWAALPSWIAQALTLLLVIFAWVPFRASTMTAAWSIWRSMLGTTGAMPVNPTQALAYIVPLLFVALVMPNTAEIFGRGEKDSWAKWKVNAGWSVGLGAALGIAVGLSFGNPVSFLYFRF
ncbi:MAG: MBOAT family protein [Rhizobiales bacterium]|nr:MBOAT family protein [Hyphomicrobiales bacterium]